MAIVNILVYFPPVFVMYLLNKIDYSVCNYIKLPLSFHYDVFQIQKSLKTNTMSTHIAI